MFYGSEHSPKSFFDVIEHAGATDLNGTTNEDRTNYFENVPINALDLALFLESDRMGHLLGAITQEKLDQQRGVVQNEKRQGENDPYGLVWDYLTPKLYPPNHPYSWTVIGSMVDLDAAKLDDVKDWFRANYGAANAVLSVAGDVNPDSVLAKVQRYFGDIPSGPPVTHQETWIAKRTGHQRGVMEDRVPQARVYRVWNVPEWGSADGDYLALAGQVLSAGKSSRLFKRLVYDEQIATDVSAYADLREIAGLFVVQASVRPGVDPAKVERALDQELARLLASGPTPPELARARARIRAGFIRGVERIGGGGGSPTCSPTARSSPDGPMRTRSGCAGSRARRRRRCGPRPRAGSRMGTTPSRCGPSPTTRPRRPARTGAIRPHRARRRRRSFPSWSARRSPTGSRWCWPSAARFLRSGSTSCSTPASRPIRASCPAPRA